MLKNLSKKTATTLAIAGAIFFLALGHAHAMLTLDEGNAILPVGTSDTWSETPSPGFDCGYPIIFDVSTGLQLYSSSASCGSFGALERGYQGKFAILEVNDPTCVNSGYDYQTCKSYPGLISEIDFCLYTDPSFCASPVSNGNIFLPNTDNSDQIAAVGTVSTGLIGALWPIILLAIGIPLAFYLLDRMKDLVPKDTDNDAKLEAIKATTEHMKNEHRGDEIVEKLSTRRGRKPPLAM